MATTPHARRWRGALAPHALSQWKMNVTTKSKGNTNGVCLFAAGALGPVGVEQAERGECLTKGQATKGARWMPWRYGPMKDVARLR